MSWIDDENDLWISCSVGWMEAAAKKNNVPDITTSSDSQVTTSLLGF